MRPAGGKPRRWRVPVRVAQTLARKQKNQYLDLLTDSIGERSVRTPSLAVAELIRACGSLEFQTDASERSLARAVTVPQIQSLGLALAGFTHNLRAGSVQVLETAEIEYLRARPDSQTGEAFAKIAGSEIACLLVPGGEKLSSPFRKALTRAAIPLLNSKRSSPEVLEVMRPVLDEALAPSINFHGDLVVFCGLGILILGKSGIGKSDCALDLITHGHQLVADDWVQVRRNSLGQLIGKGKDLIRHHMDVRGLGIINVKELFSIYSVIEEYTVDLVIFLEPWDPKKNYACFQKQESLNLLGMRKPLLRLPVGSGRNWENLIQVAVRNFIIKSKGYDAERDLAQKVDRILEEKD